jgi:hypothetical protein
VRQELARFGPAAGMAEVVTAWPGAVGEAIARNAWPARIGRDGTLHVHASSSAWAFELAQLESELLGRLREAVGDAAPPRLRFAVGNVPESLPATDADVRPAVPEPTEDEVGQAAELTAGIGDEELRKLVQRAAAASLARARSDRTF